ncbi:hypothetical protein NCS52_00353900 [Fusarium sp. LHS14.1]|nr:hypothetical protein NCS52_00353900 [Fusarium sp. LHS14.1]
MSIKWANVKMHHLCLCLLPDRHVLIPCLLTEYTYHYHERSETMTAPTDSEGKPPPPVVSWESIPLDTDWKNTIDTNWYPGIEGKRYCTAFPSTEKKAWDRGTALVALSILGFCALMYSIWDRICRWEELIWLSGDTATMMLLRAYRMNSFPN